MCLMSLSFLLLEGLRGGRLILYSLIGRFEDLKICGHSLGVVFLYLWELGCSMSIHGWCFMVVVEDLLCLLWECGCGCACACAFDFFEILVSLIQMEFMCLV